MEPLVSFLHNHMHVTYRMSTHAHTHTHTYTHARAHTLPVSHKLFLKRKETNPKYCIWGDTPWRILYRGKILFSTAEVSTTKKVSPWFWCLSKISPLRQHKSKYLQRMHQELKASSYFYMIVLFCNYETLRKFLKY